MIAHVVGNYGQPDIPRLVGWANLIVGLLGLLLTLLPERVLLLAASFATLASVALEMPVTGNHWLLAGFVSLAVLVGRGKYEQYGGTLRWMFVIFYGFAAFAKVNRGFFDPTTSCAVFYANEGLSALGLPTIPGGSLLREITIWTTVLAELAVVPLLLTRRTRYAGVVLASAFHVMISFDLGQHFYDFTSVLLCLLVLFLPKEAMIRLKRLSLFARFNPRVGSAVWLIVGAVLVVLAVTPVARNSNGVLQSLPFLLWIPFGVIWIWWLVRGWSPSREKIMTTNAAGVVLLAIVAANGVAPYLELKTAQGFNMYSNLLTAAGETNHLVIPRTLPMRDGYEGPVRIIESSDAGLELYADLGYLVAYPELRRFLSERPDTSLTYERFGQRISLSRAREVSELVDSGPWWWRFLPLRSLDRQTPPRCQAVFLPAL